MTEHNETKMQLVTKKEFFDALNEANKKGLDPMPERKNDNWRCQKTHKVFGKTIHIKSPNIWEYYLRK